MTSRPDPARRRAGFTIAELLIVLVLLGLILGLVGTRLVGQFGRGQARAAEAQLALLASGLDLFRIDTGRLPTEAEGLAALLEAPPGLRGWKGPYLRGSALPLDPWGNAYVFEVPGDDGQPFALRSLGSDGRPGGAGDAADLVADAAR